MSAQKSKKSTPAKKGKTKEMTEEMSEVTKQPEKTTVVEIDVSTTSNGDTNRQPIEQSKKTKKSNTKKNQDQEQKLEDDEEFQGTTQVQQEQEKSNTKNQKKIKKGEAGVNGTQSKNQTTQPEDKDTNTESQTTERKPKKTSQKNQVNQYRQGELTFEALSLNDDKNSQASTKSKTINGYQKYQKIMAPINTSFGERAKNWGKLSQQEKDHFDKTSEEVLRQEYAKKK